MLSLLLITALAVQYPQPASKPATDTTSSPPRRSTTAVPGTSQSATSRQAFHDRMRELWSDHITYMRNFIVSSVGAQGDTAEVLQRLFRNQDELGEAIKPYYGDAAGMQLASLLRNHIQLAGKTLTVAKGTGTAMAGMSKTSTQDTSAQYTSSRAGDTASSRAQYPTPTGRMNDTTKAAGVSGQTQYGQQAAQGDSTSLNQAIAALKANADSIADFLAKANPRGFNQGTLRGALQMHITLLLKEATAHVKKDWSGSIAAFDESQRQGLQMADVLSEGIMKQFPSRFNNKATTVSSR